MLSYSRLFRKTNRVVNPGRLVGESKELYNERCMKLIKFPSKLSANIVNPPGWDKMLLSNVTEGNMDISCGLPLIPTIENPLPPHDPDREEEVVLINC